MDDNKIKFDSSGAMTALAPPAKDPMTGGPMSGAGAPPAPTTAPMPPRTTADFHAANRDALNSSIASIIKTPNMNGDTLSAISGLAKNYFNAAKAHVMGNFTAPQSVPGTGAVANQPTPPATTGGPMSAPAVPATTSTAPAPGAGPMSPITALGNDVAGATSGYMKGNWEQPINFGGPRPAGQDWAIPPQEREPVMLRDAVTGENNLVGYSGKGRPGYYRGQDGRLYIDSSTIPQGYTSEDIAKIISENYANMGSMSSAESGTAGLMNAQVSEESKPVMAQAAMDKAQYALENASTMGQLKVTQAEVARLRAEEQQRHDKAMEGIGENRVQGVADRAGSAMAPGGKTAIANMKEFQKEASAFLVRSGALNKKSGKLNPAILQHDDYYGIYKLAHQYGIDPATAFDTMKLPYTPGPGQPWTGVYKPPVTGGGPKAAARPAPKAATPAGIPPQAMAQLKEGHTTVFKNGQAWTLQNGQAVRVK